MLKTFVSRGSNRRVGPKLVCYVRLREIRNIVNAMSVTWTPVDLHSYYIRDTGARRHLHDD